MLMVHIYSGWAALLENNLSAEDACAFPATVLS